MLDVNLNGHLINHIMYADDLVLISPSSAGLSQLLHECGKFGTRHDLRRSVQLEGWRWTVKGDPVKYGMYLRVKFLCQHIASPRSSLPL